MTALVRSLAVLAAVALPLLAGRTAAQELIPADTTIVYQPARPDLLQSTGYQPTYSAWGLDLLVSNNGFGAGLFYRTELSEELSLIASFAISDVKDDAEVEYFDYFGQSFVPRKKNRLLLLPLVGGLQYRLFKDEIMDNFRPFVTAGLGPAMIYVSPYARPVTYQFPGGQTYTEYEQVDFFTALGQGSPRYTVGGYVGAGAYFGLDRGTISGFSLRYYYFPFPKGIEILDGVRVRDFGGLYISLNFGTVL